MKMKFLLGPVLTAAYIVFFTPAAIAAGHAVVKEHPTTKAATSTAGFILSKADKVRLTWEAVPGAVMYKLIVSGDQDANLDAAVLKREKTYINGCELDVRQFDRPLEELYWQVQPLDVNGMPLGKFSEAQSLDSGEINPSAPLTTTEFEKMDYTPLYPVYSWIPSLHAGEYELQVFFDDDNDSRTPDTLIKTARVSGGSHYDYYDDAPKIREGRYWWRVQAQDADANPISDWSKPSYFKVTHRAIKVAALGDSITHGGGAVSVPPGYRLYNWETYAGMPILNLGFSGNTAEAMAARFKSDVLPFKPKFLVIMGGINNIRVGDSADQVIHSLSEIQYMCILNRITPVFVTVAPINPAKMKTVSGLLADSGWKEQQKKINDWVASQLYYIDITPRLTDPQGCLFDRLTSDGLHPDMEGKMIIGETIGTYLKLRFSPDLGLPPVSENKKGAVK